MSHNAQYRFGSACLDDGAAALRAGYGRAADDALYIGHAASGHSLYSGGQAGVGVFAGARAGKGAFYLIRWLTDGVYKHHIINMDFKAQNGAVAAQQCFLGRRVINWNPRWVPWMNSVSINALSMLTANSPTLEADAKIFTQSFLSKSGAKGAAYFEENAQRITEAVSVTLARREGSIHLPRLAHVMGQIGSTTDTWLNVEFDMHESGSPDIVATTLDIEQWSKSATNSSGWDGIRGEIKKAFACMSDPALREALSPPFGFDFSQLVEDDGDSYMVNIAEAQEFAQSSSPVLKAMYACAAIYKRRAPQARPQLWVMDELGNIGAWPFAVELFSYGPGYGIRPVGVFQSRAQMENLAPRASQIIPNSCGTQIYFGIRDFADAAHVSRQIGRETLVYDDPQIQERARHARSQALASAFMDGGDLFEAAVNYEHQDYMAGQQSKQARDVRTPDEIINTPQGRAYVFMPGNLPAPVYVSMLPYWCDPVLAGRYLNDPFHPPLDAVSIGTPRGPEMRRVIGEKVPDRYAYLPQYTDGMWRYVEGFRP